MSAKDDIIIRLGGHSWVQTHAAGDVMVGETLRGYWGESKARQD